MTQLKELPLTTLQFYATAPYPCSYLPGKIARSQVATPSHLIHADLYGELVNAGFRRSGLYTYRPYCDECRACIATRIPVAQFQANRSQRRSWKKHQGLEIRVLNLGYQEEHYELYQQYQMTRHADDDMDRDDQDQYMQFLLQSRVNSRIVEFRDGPQDTHPGKLRMVSMIDILEQGISSVYTFFDTTNPSASYGTYSILWQIRQALELELPYLYLGYYIENSEKMSYKAKFQPIEGLIDDHWQAIVAR
ncbi:arginyltransferase [Polynucleobacter sp. es-EL-1]|jgi:arginine-tRNA-protein transferase|uniref:arginyltransferase n=1 Tax=Polynucleobacter sp. es-EL-1 TaxID=1855652 RepID=UPI000BCBFD7F|nr:arginyltransferase [Polynucleobacter sp. es-EL-1]OZA41237.1 MAG: arginyltransferase [Polynucleobacter sp. 17-46-58]HQR84006.1 arginyltransferase [Polynucleobacter sp.]QWE09744.1 arginyltransferase [Polynucleobacter sp. es-EL-1]HQS60483.1 arginyltransferase [Polynucleobacter sp.]HQT20285.1 arginyltransferase [Polynucleobacter sp.]